MKPAPFRYAPARSVEEALALLAENGSDVKILAGGQSLMPLLNMRLARPRVIVDINPLRSLDYIRRKGDRIHIGAMTRQRALEASPLVRRDLPLLHEAIRLVGHPQIRTRGTLGGSLAHADPSAELPAVVAALDGELVISGPEGERTLTADEFFTGYLTTALGHDDLLTEVRLPVLPKGTGCAFLEVARRHGDFALVGVAAVLSRNGDRIADARVAFTGVGPRPFRTRDAEAMLRDGPAPETFAEAARVAAARLEPDGDIHATAEYRREVAEVLAYRALVVAWTGITGRAKGR